MTLEQIWNVLMNDEEQYALLPAVVAVPPGWREVGFRGTEQACMGYVDVHWTDLRPRSLRDAMDGPA